MQLLTYVLFSVIFFNLLLSIFVISQDRKSWNNRLFSLVSFLAAIWTLTNYMTGVYSDPFWLESTYATGSLVVSTGLIWIIYISDNKVARWQSILISISAIFFFIASYFPGFIAERYDTIYIGGVFTGKSGIGLAIYSLYFLVASLLMLFKLYITRINEKDLQRKQQLKFVLLGAFTTLVISALTSFILPVLDIFTFGGLDSVGFLIFLGFIAFSITRHKLFDIRIIATEILIFTLWLVQLFRTFYSVDAYSLFINIIVLLATIIIGILLIRSVLKEVQTRERVEALAQDLSKVNEQLEVANVRLKELDRQKSEFVSIASHQLRSPLTAMKGYSSMLLEGSFGKVGDKARDAIDRIFQSSQRLAIIIDDFLNISRIEQGRMQYEFSTVDVDELIKSILKEMESPIKNAGLTIKYSKADNGPFKVTADFGKIRQVITNIIDNSIKYTPKGGIEVTLHKDDVGHKIMIEVTDTGIGIEPEVMPLLFQKFSRAEDAGKTNIQGTGLGLFVAKEIMKAHRGSIWVDSPGKGKGSTFYLSFLAE